ncbi:MAG: hypothetical protein DHS20C09_12270 [marine bacterium B5-7]|nr:MAG: hypothetical protein DHS20C09_12270 [marine bacterium B5-7]
MTIRIIKGFQINIDDRASLPSRAAITSCPEFFMILDAVNIIVRESSASSAFMVICRAIVVTLIIHV